MDDWTRYKEKCRKESPEMAREIDEIEAKAEIIAAIINQRHKMDISQRELAELCGIPHSSIARIESGKSTPNLSTLIKIFNKLGLQLAVRTL